MFVVGMMKKRNLRRLFVTYPVKEKNVTYVGQRDKTVILWNGGKDTEYKYKN